LIRSISTVAQDKRKKLGVVRTDAQVFGGFTFTGGQPQNTPKAAIIEEYEKQYDVSEVDPANPIDTDKYDVMLVIQPSSLGPVELDNVVQMIRKGQPTAIFEDPLPVIGEMQAVPGTGMPKRQNPMAQMFGGGGPPPPKGDITRLWDALGIEAEGEKPLGAGFQQGPSMFSPFIIWQRFKPYKKIEVQEFSDEYVFIRPEVPGGDEPFNLKEPATAGLEEVLFLMCGAIRPRRDSDLKFTPIVSTGTNAGTITFDKWRQNRENPAMLKVEEGASKGTRYVLAARIEGAGLDKNKSSREDSKKDGEEADVSGKDETRPVNVIYVTDIDLVATNFVRLRAQPDEDIRWRFENITFALNVVDALSGDDRYMNIRRRRSSYSTLRVIERLTDNARMEEEEKRRDFAADFTKAIEEEEAKRKQSIEKIVEGKKKMEERRRKGEFVDPQELENLGIREAIQVQENQLSLVATRDRLERTRDDKIAEARRKMDLRVLNIQREFKIWAVVLPPIPPLLIGLVVWIRRRLREREGISRSRLR